MAKQPLTLGLVHFGPEARAHDRAETRAIASAVLAAIVVIAFNYPESLWWNRPAPYPGLDDLLWGVAAIGVSYALLRSLFAGENSWDRGLVSDANWGSAWLLAVGLGFLLGPTATPGLMLLFPFRRRSLRMVRGPRLWAFLRRLGLGAVMLWFAFSQHPLGLALFLHALLFGGGLLLALWLFFYWRYGEPEQPGLPQDDSETGDAK